MPAAVAIPAIIGAGSSIAQGVIGSRAARGAANTQAQAATTIADLARRAGEQAAGDVTAEGERGAAAVTGAGENAATNIEGATQGAAANTRQAAADAQAGYRISADEANSILRAIYGDAIDQLGGYREAGTVALGELANPDFSRPITQSDIQMDPGFDFRMKEGQKAIERSAAASGALRTGGTLKALTQYAQGVASDEYSRAFERFRTDRNDRFSRMTSLAGIGLRATESGIAAGENYGNRAAANVMDSGTRSADIGYRGEADANDFTVRGVDAAGRIRLGSVGDAARMRLGATESAGRFRVDGTRQANQALGAAADATAAGTVGAANAWGRTIGTVGRIGQEAYPTVAMRPRPRTLPMNRVGVQTGM